MNQGYLPKNYTSSNDSEEFLLYNPYAEELVLMGMMSNPALARKCFSEIQDELFYLPENKIIFQAMQKLYIENQAINPITIIYHLKGVGLLEKVGGHRRILKLGKLIFGMSFHTLKSYLIILKDKHIKRQLVQISRFFYKIAYNHKSYKKSDFDRIQKQLSKITQDKESKKLVHISDIVETSFNRLRTPDSKTSKVLTGFYNLDHIINGLEPGNLIIIAGRPSIGKTAFSLSLSLNICKFKPSACILYLSLEMTTNQIINRLMVIDSNLPLAYLKSIESYNLTGMKLHELFASLYRSNLYISDSELISLEEIDSSMRKLQAQHQQIDLVVIDYLQLLGNARDNRAQELAYITRSLKGLAKSFNVPIITLSQLNRNVEQRSNKRPMLADLRESGCVSKDTCIFIDYAENTIQEKIKIFLVGNFFSLKVINTLTNQFQETYAARVIQSGKKHLYQLKICDGSNLFLSANHKVLTITGWKRLDQLVEYESVAVIRKSKDIISTFGNSQKRSQKKFVFRRLTQILYAKKEETYDMQIPPFENFIANNIILHNSIEQDADMVLLLYRDNYYRRLPNITEDVTEVIVAKNRNGKTGTVTVKFYPETARFE